MRSKNYSMYILALCYSIFSFAMVIPPQDFTIWDWIWSLSLNGLLYVFFSLLIFNNKETKPLADLFSLVYILLLISKQLYQVNSYMKVYHRHTSLTGNILITMVLVFIITSMSVLKLERLTPAVTTMVVLLVATVFFLNMNKFNPINLYEKTAYNKIGFFNITMFDYIIPLNIAINNRESNLKSKSVIFIIVQVLLMICISIFAFGNLKGNLMYSISPLQMLFQISSGDIIKNFDAIYNFLLYFAYFSALLLLISAYSRIKNRFTYIGKEDLLLILVFLIFIDKIDNGMWFLLQLVMAAILLFGRKKGVMNAKF